MARNGSLFEVEGPFVEESFFEGSRLIVQRRDFEIASSLSPLRRRRNREEAVEKRDAKEEEEGKSSKGEEKEKREKGPRDEEREEGGSTSGEKGEGGEESWMLFQKRVEGVK